MEQKRPPDVNANTSKPLLLQVGPLSATLNKRLAERYAVMPLWTQAPDWLEAQRGCFDGAVAMSRHLCSEAVLDAVKAGGVLTLFGVGYDNVDFAAAARKRIC